MPPVPERRIAVRSWTSPRCSSGARRAGRVDRRPRDVGVDVDAARHDDHAAGVDLRRVLGDVVDDLAVAQADVAHLAVDAVGRVVDAAAGDAQRHAAASRARAMRSAIA